MALDLHVCGPGLDVHCRLEEGDPALVLGRDTDCAVCLPDPERNISRRHLSVWNEGGQLHFHVLSAVNGIVTAAGELPPGARGVLACGETMGLSAYRIDVGVASAEASAARPADPWAEFERQASQLVPDGEGATVPAAPDADDPFEWGFQSTFGPDSSGAGLDSEALQPAHDVLPFLRGLGLQAQAGFTQGELESLGRLTRIALQGLLQAAQAAAAARQDAGSEDRTVPEVREPNPLRLGGTLEDKLAFLFGGQLAGPGFLPPDRALAQLAGELTAHQQAMAQAARDTVHAVVQEFDPEALKKRLLGGSARIFESTRAWDAFVRDYAERRAKADEWTAQLMDRHFATAYARAMLRAKRNTPGRNGV
jgi:predicted component of type VI protein secretion system